MPGSAFPFFLDTNILIYTFDETDLLRRAKARELVETALTTHQGMISFQVVQEFLNVALTKFLVPLTPADCLRYLERALVPLWRVFCTPDLYRSALEVRRESGYGFYDSLIVAAALEGGCRTLYSQDLQNGRAFGKLIVTDPFT